MGKVFDICYKNMTTIGEKALTIFENSDNIGEITVESYVKVLTSDWYTFDLHFIKKNLRRLSYERKNR